MQNIFERNSRTKNRTENKIKVFRALSPSTHQEMFTAVFKKCCCAMLLTSFSKTLLASYSSNCLNSPEWLGNSDMIEVCTH